VTLGALYGQVPGPALAGLDAAAGRLPEDAAAGCRRPEFPGSRREHSGLGAVLTAGTGAPRFMGVQLACKALDPVLRGCDGGAETLRSGPGQAGGVAATAAAGV